MNAIKEIKGLKCPNHDYVRDNYNFTYEPSYPGARPLNSTRCMRCGYTMSLHKVQKVILSLCPLTRCLNGDIV